jgi:superfamily II DNA or RNA helicase
MGLSATPVHYLDNARNTRLEQFYGPVVYEYSLSQAIIDNVLTPYDYHVMLIELTFEETEQFLDLSQQIGKLYAKDLQAGLSQNESEILKSLLRSRTRLVGAAENKLKVLHDHLQSTPRSKHVLFYCSEGVVNSTEAAVVDDDDSIGVCAQSNVAAVCQLLTNSGWNVSKFTAAETMRDREVLLEHFKLGKIDALVAMRCLDEGIDIPSCSIAYILASTKDPRQFIQRRGRILRRAPGKQFATIYDFVVVPPNSATLEGNPHARKLIEGELRRVAEFAGLAQNSTKAYEVLRPTLINYGLEYCV